MGQWRRTRSRPQNFRTIRFEASDRGRTQFGVLCAATRGHTDAAPPPHSPGPKSSLFSERELGCFTLRARVHVGAPLGPASRGPRICQYDPAILGRLLSTQGNGPQSAGRRTARPRSFYPAHLLQTFNRQKSESNRCHRWHVPGPPWCLIVIALTVRGRPERRIVTHAVDLEALLKRFIDTDKIRFAAERFNAVEIEASWPGRTLPGPYSASQPAEIGDIEPSSHRAAAEVDQ